MERQMDWQLDTAGARNYERFLVPALMDPWADRLVGAVGTRAGHRVLDLACGTGIVARHAARHVGPSGSVEGVDVNPSMLAVAREVTADVEPEIGWHEAPADDLPFPDESFDVAICQQGVQFFADRAAALAELHRVTAPGGRLGISTCRSITHQPGYAVLMDVLTRHVGVHAGEILRSPYALGELEDLRGLVQQAGFRDVHITIAVSALRAPTPRAFLEGETASSPLGDIVDALDEDVIDAVLADLTDGLLPHTDDDGVAFPFETIVLTATR